ncbi:unnamed protein product [Jaminaea pallidilutea]
MRVTKLIFHNIVSALLLCMLLTAMSAWSEPVVILNSNSTKEDLAMAASIRRGAPTAQMNPQPPTVANGGAFAGGGEGSGHTTTIVQSMSPGSTSAEQGDDQNDSPGNVAESSASGPAATTSAASKNETSDKNQSTCVTSVEGGGAGGGASSTGQEDRYIKIAGILVPAIVAIGLGIAGMVVTLHVNNPRRNSDEDSLYSSDSPRRY